MESATNIAQGFSRSEEMTSQAFSHAKEYDATRVDYPREPVEFLLNKLDVLSTTADSDRPLVILELGAGTGKFTKVMAEVLKDSPVKIIASDPQENMCEIFRSNLPDVEVHQFAAQKIGEFPVMTRYLL